MTLGSGDGQIWLTHTCGVLPSWSSGISPARKRMWACGLGDATNRNFTATTKSRQEESSIVGSDGGQAWEWERKRCTGRKKDVPSTLRQACAVADPPLRWTNCKILCEQRRRSKRQGTFQFFAVSTQCYSERLLLPKWIWGFNMAAINT